MRPIIFIESHNNIITRQTIIELLKFFSTNGYSTFLNEHDEKMNVKEFQSYVKDYIKNIKEILDTSSSEYEETNPKLIQLAKSQETPFETLLKLLEELASQQFNFFNIDPRTIDDRRLEALRAAGHIPDDDPRVKHIRDYTTIDTRMTAHIATHPDSIILCGIHHGIGILTNLLLLGLNPIVVQVYNFATDKEKKDVDNYLDNSPISWGKKYLLQFQYDDNTEDLWKLIEDHLKKNVELPQPPAEVLGIQGESAKLYKEAIDKNNDGVKHTKAKNYTSAIECYMAALKLISLPAAQDYQSADKELATEKLATIRKNLGVTYREMGMHHLALKQFETAATLLASSQPDTFKELDLYQKLETQIALAKEKLGLATDAPANPSDFFKLPAASQANSSSATSSLESEIKPGGKPS